MDVYAAASVDRNLVCSNFNCKASNCGMVANLVGSHYVQGGGCTSVGVVGWHIGGGFGHWSKKFGTGPANMLEARVEIQ